MESLFKIDKIDGKGLGWIALQDIKSGTLIYKEKPQFIRQDFGRGFGKNWTELMIDFAGFRKMNKIDQDEFLNLTNAFSDPDSIKNVGMKKLYFYWKNKAEFECKDTNFSPKIDTDLMLKIRGIYIGTKNKNHVREKIDFIIDFSSL